MTGLGSLDTTFFAPPGHDNRTRSDFTFQNLIPADNLAASLPQILSNMLHDIALKFLLLRVYPVISQPEFRYKCLTFRAMLPLRLRALVTADMNIF